MKGSINIILEGATPHETERCRQVIHQLFEEGFFNIRSGSFTANFDESGEMMTTEKRIIRRKTKPILEKALMEAFVVETMPLDNSTVARRIEV